MNKSEKQRYVKRGRVAAMWCALAGVGIALALMAPFSLQELAAYYTINLAIALAALFAAAWFLGGRAGNLILVQGWSPLGTSLVLGIACLLISVLAGSIFTFFSEGQPEVYGFGSAAYDYIVKPLFWVSVFGLIPCVVLSFVFAKLITRNSSDGLREPVA